MKENLNQRPSGLFSATKKWSGIIIMGAVVLWLVIDAWREFSSNETVQYFSKQPLRLFYVATIGIIGGLATLAFYRIPTRAQRHVKFFSLGLAAIIITAFLGYFLFCLISISSSAGKIIPGTVQPVLGFAAVASYLWFEFYRGCRKRNLHNAGTTRLG